MTSHFRSPTRTFQFIVFCIVFARQDAIIFMSIPEVFGLCSTDSCCSTIRNVIQIDRWSAFCVGSTLVSILHTFYKKENGIGITSRHSMLHLIQQQASLSLRYVLLLLGGTRIPTWRKVKQSWGLWLWICHRLVPLTELIEFAAPIGTWLRVVSFGSLRAQFWILLSLLGEGKELSSRESSVLQRRCWAASRTCSKTTYCSMKRSHDLQKGNTLIGLLRPNVGRSEDTTSATTTTQQQQ
jgi:hypothetical protein